MAEAARPFFSTLSVQGCGSCPSHGGSALGNGACGPSGVLSSHVCHVAVPQNRLSSTRSPSGRLKKRSQVLPGHHPSRKVDARASDVCLQEL